MIALVPVIILIVGLLAYALAANPKVSEAGRIAYFVGLFWLVAQFAGKTLKLMAFVTLVSLSVYGCGFCQQAANKDTARCKAQNVVTNCAAPEVIKIVLSILPDLRDALVTSTYDNLIQLVEAKLSGQGINDVWGVISCSIHAIEATPQAGRGASPVHEHGDSWIKAHPVKTTGSTPVAAYGGASIIRLFFGGRPAAVTGFVVPVVVDPIDRSLVARSGSHVLEERLKRISPALTNGNAAPTPSGEVSKIRIMASLNDSYPRPMLYRSSSSVSLVTQTVVSESHAVRGARHHLSVETSAGSRLSSKEEIDIDFLFDSTFASRLPPASPANIEWAQKREPSIDFADQIGIVPLGHEKQRNNQYPKRQVLG